MLIFNKNKFLKPGIKVINRTAKPSNINTELLGKFAALPVWYRKFIRPIASMAYAPKR